MLIASAIFLFTMIFPFFHVTLLALFEILGRVLRFIGFSGTLPKSEKQLDLIHLDKYNLTEKHKRQQKRGRCLYLQNSALCYSDGSRNLDSVPQSHSVRAGKDQCTLSIDVPYIFSNHVFFAGISLDGRATQAVFVTLC